MKKIIWAFVTVAIFTVACDKGKTPDNNSEKPEFKNRSNAESFVTVLPEFASTITAYTLLSSSDSIKGLPGFVYGGAPDGQGF